MNRVEFQKHKFDQRIKLGVFLALLTFAAFLVVSESSLAPEIITLIIGLAGGNVIASHE